MNNKQCGDCLEYKEEQEILETENIKLKGKNAKLTADLLKCQ